MYSVIEEEVYMEGDLHRSFGIGVGDCKISDITTDEHIIRALVDRINRMELMPVHLHDVLEDFLFCSCP